MKLAKILIVDDEDVARLTLLRILQLEGYEVTAVNNGNAALQELGIKPYDLMIIDHQMPGMNGLDVLSITTAEFPHLKTIMLTGQGTLDTAIQALRYRIQDFLKKPATPEDLLASVKNVLGDGGESGQRGIGEKQTDYLTGQQGAYEKVVFHMANGIVIDCRKQRIEHKTGMVSLTPNETRLMGILLSNNTLVLSHEELVIDLYGYRVSAEEASKILRPVISRLNKKLAHIPGATNWIKSVRGKGYFLDLVGQKETTE